MLKVINIHRNDINNRLAMTIRGTENEDFLLAQEVFRALISCHFCVESSFGYDQNMNEVLVFKYPKNRDVTILYDSSAGRYGATWLKPIKKQEVE
jgi:hypothetical protein